MTRLATIRRELGTLRRRRQGVRWSTALCGLAIIVLWVLALAFILDFSLKMATAQRAAFLVLYAIVTVWAVRKYVSPWIGHRETEIDMALLVEKHQKIDSELVAALQFESAEAETWGSPRLRTAVVDYVVEYGRNWNFLEGVPTGPLRVRAGLLAVTGLLAIGAIILWPGHVAAFMQRFCLMNTRYPSQTRIVHVRLKSELGDLKLADAGYRGPYGKKLTFEFYTEGTLPEEGRLEMTSGDERRAPLAIKKTKHMEGDSTIYEATLDRLLKPLAFRAYLNDTWTEPENIAVIPTPVVELKLHATAPEYARGVVASEVPTPERQITVLQGSEVGLELTCANKSLTEARLLVKPLAADKASEQAADKASDKPSDWTTIGLIRADKQGRAWRLVSAGSPLARVREKLLYKVEVVDEDGLSTDGEITGSVSVKPDAKPTVSAVASAGTTRVLPQAKPRFDITVGDDFAIASLAVHIEIARQAEGSGPVEPGAAETADLNIPLEGAPLLLRDGHLPYKVEKYVLPLEPYQLRKGDQVKVYFEAVDFRGADNPGEKSLKEALVPIVLTVTDDSGIIAGITERDELGVKQIDEINKTQLGTGGNK